MTTNTTLITNEPLRRPQRHPRRFHSELELLNEIKIVQARSEALFANATRMEAHARCILQSDDGTLVDQALDDLEEVQRMRKQAHNLIHTRVPKLNRALAVLRTPTFPFIEDPSVVL